MFFFLLLFLRPALSFVPPALTQSFWQSCSSPTQLNASPVQKLPDLSQAAFPEVPEEPYDLVVLGSGPGGETAAAHAAQLGARVAVVEVKRSFGGPTGLTSKAVREAAKQICRTVDQVGGDRRRQIRRLWSKRFPALRGEAEVLQAAETRDRLARNQCDLYVGAAELIPDEGSASGLAVRVCRPTECVELPARHVIVATGSRPHRPNELRPGVKLPFVPNRVVDATEMGKLTELPNAVAILGGGVIAVEYATVLAQLGVGVSLLCSERNFMPFLPSELRAALRRRMVRDRILFLDADVERIDVGSDDLVRVLLAPKPKQPRRLRVDLVLFSGGRDANSQGLGCEKVGVDVGRFGRILVDNCYRTNNPSVYAVGDVVGPPGLASSAAQQARYVTDLLFKRDAEAKAERLRAAMLNSATDIDDAVCDDDFFVSPAPQPSSSASPASSASVHSGDTGGRSVRSAEDLEEESIDEHDVGEAQGSLFGRNRIDAPLTLWTIPEIASVGLSEETARSEAAASRVGRQVVVGRAFFKDLARGRLSGDLEGFMLIVARVEGPQRHVIVGVHIVGEGANELIQLGSILVYSSATLEQVSNTPFAAVTLSGLYQMASDDALQNSPLNLLRQPLLARQRTQMGEANTFEAQSVL